MKIKRQRAILNLINKEEITTQEELCEQLNSLGFKVTQATVSRDIKELKLLKVPSEHSTGSKYASLEHRSSANNVKGRLNGMMHDTVLSVDHAMNIVVLKTLDGMAQGVAALLDAADEASIMGTIAGDNTIMILTKSEAKAKGLTEKLKKILNLS